LLEEVPAVADIVHRAYRYIVVDELQDTSGYQLKLVARVSNEGATTVFAVADDDQMIYAWRDARTENLAEWETRFRAKRVSLLGNYRCPQRIVDAANALIAHNDQRLAAGQQPYSRVTDREGTLLRVQVANEHDQAEWIAKFIAQELASGVAPEDVAVLAANRFTFDDIASALDRRGVPFVRVGEDPAAGRPLARALRAALVLAANPTNVRARRRLASLLGEAADDEAVDELIGAPTLDTILTALTELIALSPEDEDIEHVRRILRSASRDFGGADPRRVGTRIALEWHRLSIRLQREEQSVKVMTTFAAKGLEFRIVIMPSFALGVAPWQPRGVRADRAWWAEERRKVYVAITRAKETVAFAYSGTPSVFLAEIPSDLLTAESPF
jgi:superfamily I DNA/RNA helicase